MVTHRQTNNRQTKYCNPLPTRRGLITGHTLALAGYVGIDCIVVLLHIVLLHKLETVSENSSHLR